MSTNVGEIDLSLVLNSDKFDSQLSDTESKANSASTKISSALSKIGKAVAVAFSVTAIVKFGKECLSVATETSNAWIGLNSILTGQGKSFSEAQSYIEDYISDGLVPLNNAVAAYKNLALRGYSSDQIQKTMDALKNSATFARQSTYTLGEAVQTATEGLKNENSVVVDNAGVTKNVAKMWEDYAKSIGKTTDSLTQEEKIQAEVNGILEETQFQSNDAAIYAETYSGKLAELSTAFTTLKTAIGNVIQPIAKLVIPVITKAINAVTKLFTAFASLMSLFGLKADSVETVSSSLDDTAESAEDASSAISDAGDSTEEAAKKANNNLAAWDSLNVLNDDSDSSSDSSSSDSSGVSSDLADELNVSSTVEEDTSAFDGLLSRLKELASIFKSGFEISFGDTNFDEILTHLNNIKNTLIEIWTDPEVVGAANTWANTVAYTLGQVTGSVARIGTNLAEGLVGSIDTYLSQNKDRIKNFIIDMFDVSVEHMTLVGNFAQAIGQISDVLSGDTAKQIGANIIAMFANPLMSAYEVIEKFGVDLESIFLQPIIDNVDKIKTTIENVMKPIESITGTFAEALTYIGDKINEVYDTYIHPFMESLKSGLSDSFSKFLDVYNEYVVPFCENIASGIQDLWENHLKALIDKIGEFVGAIAEALTALWEGAIKPLIDWIVANVIPVLVPIFESIWNTIKNVFGSIADVIGGIIETFTGLINFIVGIFTGDWEKAWEGIKTFFSGIWDTIKGIVSTVWNAISGIISTVIEVIKGVITVAFNAIKSVISTVLNAIKTVVSTIWNGISATITNVVNSIKTTITNTLNTIKTTWSNIWTVIKTTVTTIFDNIKTTISNAITAVKTTISNIITIIKTTWSNTWNSIKTTTSDIWNNIKTVISNAINGVKTTISNVINTIKSTISTIFNSIKSTISSIWNSIKSTISSVINSIKTTISNVINSIKSSISSVFNSIKSTISSIWNSIKSSISSVVTSIKNSIVNTFTSAYNSVTNLFNKLKSFFSNIWSSIKSTFTKLGTSIGSAISDAVKSGINNVITLIQNTINKAINLINGAIGVINKLPGVNVSKISTLSLPKLAEGGYVKANTPQLAMIGDNKTQGEIVAPENKMLDMILTALKMFKEENTSNQNNNGDLNLTLNFAGNLAELARILKPELDNESKRKGAKLIIGGVN